MTKTSDLVNDLSLSQIKLKINLNLSSVVRSDCHAHGFEELAGDAGEVKVWIELVELIVTEKTNQIRADQSISQSSAYLITKFSS